MKILWSWLGEYVACGALTPEHAAERLTRSGAETSVEQGYEWASWFTVALVESVEAHPQSDHLSVCQVLTGNGQRLTIVCGASNVRAGLKTLLAVPGCTLPGEKAPLGKAVLRGVPSQGMLCSAQELWVEDLLGDRDGIIELPQDIPLGTTLKELMPPEWVLHVEVTPNRGDLLSHQGLARELVALGCGQPIEPKAVPELMTPCPNIAVTSKGCSQIFFYTFDHVSQGKTPAWMRRRLLEVGVKCHFPCVDMTNYIAEDRGQPLHAFDGQEIVGEIVVRESHEGEVFEALDDQKFELPQGLIVIADDVGILSLAGVMGGKRGKCQPESRTIIIEAASFDPHQIARAGQATGISSQARYRFERGVDPAQVQACLALIGSLIAQDCEGASSRYRSFHTTQSPTKTPILFDFTQIRTVGGADLDAHTIQSRLESLGARVEIAGDKANVTPPSWRHDWNEPHDCVEEVLRLNGYQDVAACSLHGELTRIKDQKETGPSLLPLAYDLLWKARRFLVSQGLYEVVTWSFLSRSQGENFFPEKKDLLDDLTLMNPISPAMAILRPCIVPQLLSVYDHHKHYNLTFSPIFEVGPQFAGTEPKDQQEVAAAVIPFSSGQDWQKGHTKTTFYDVKGIVERTLDALKIKEVHWKKGGPEWYHPGQCVQAWQTHNGQEGLVANLGALHPRLGYPLFAFELFLNALHSCMSTQPYDLPSLQPVTKDLSFFVPSDCQVGDVMRVFERAGQPELVHLHLVDVFQEVQGQKSITIRCLFQPKEQAFSGDQLQALMEKVAQAGKAFGAELRGELKTAL